MGEKYLKQINQTLRAAQEDDQLFDAIVNAPFLNKINATRLDLGIVVLLLVNKKAKTIDRIALSRTDAAAGAVKMSEKPFRQIKIPLDHKENAIARAIARGVPQFVSDWKYLFVPDLDPRAARFNQAGAGIEFSAIFPLRAREGGAIIFSFFQEPNRISLAHHKFMTLYCKVIDQYLRGQHG